MRLRSVLSRCMIRASKRALYGSLLPPCHKHIVRLPFKPAHQAQYNLLIEVLPCCAIIDTICTTKLMQTAWCKPALC